MYSENKNYTLIKGNLCSEDLVTHIWECYKIKEVIHFAAQSHVGVSFELPNYTSQVNSIGTLNLLQAINDCGLGGKTRFYQASTSELYGMAQQSPQNEKSLKTHY